MKSTLTLVDIGLSKVGCLPTISQVAPESRVLRWLASCLGYLCCLLSQHKTLTFP